MAKRKQTKDTCEALGKWTCEQMVTYVAEKFPTEGLNE